MSDLTCTDLIAREFWVDGKQIEELVCFFLVFNNGDILKASFNDEVYIWELVGTNQAIDLKYTDMYPTKNYTPNSSLPLGDLDNYIVEKSTKMKLNFSSGLQVVLIHDIETEKNSVKIDA